jgi:hypothetical protein
LRGSATSSADGATRPLGWHLFGEGNPIEWLLGAVTGTLIVVKRPAEWAESAPLSDGSGRIFWLIFAVGATMMLREDRQRASSLRRLGRMIGVIDAESRMSLAVEAEWFACIAAVFVWAALAHARKVQFPGKTLTYGFLDVAFYALAVISSATRDLGDW